MTKLLVQELRDELFQEITLSGEERNHVLSISIYLYIHNNPSGTFTFTLSNQSEDLYSKNFTAQDVLDSISTSDNYAHVFFPFVPVDSLKVESGNFFLRLSSNGYTVTSGSFIGWIQQHEDEQNQLGYIAAGDEEKSLSYRIKILREGIL